MNEKQQIICQRDDPKYDVFNVFEVNGEDIRQVSRFAGSDIMHRIKKSHCSNGKDGEQKADVCSETAYSMVSSERKTDYIGIVGYFDIVKEENTTEQQG